MNDILKNAYHFRYACKRFDPERAVSEEDFQTILEVARLSPTSFGFDPWNIVVLRDPKIREKLYPLAWGARNSLDGASHFVILLARRRIDTVYSSDYVDYVLREVHKMPEDLMQSRRDTFRSFQENSFKLLESDRAIFDWACKQTYIVLANMLSAAALLGVDSCPIEGFEREQVNEMLAREGVFDPEHFGVSVMAGFGYRGEQPRRAKARQAMENMVKWI